MGRVKKDEGGMMKDEIFCGEDFTGDKSNVKK
jgi:hypothetical protein